MKGEEWNLLRGIPQKRMGISWSETPEHGARAAGWILRGSFGHFFFAEFGGAFFRCLAPALAGERERERERLARAAGGVFTPKDAATERESERENERNIKERKRK